MKRFFLPAVFLIAGCQLPNAETDVLTADSYLRRVPPVKTAVVHLMNEDVSRDDIEYQQFMDRLKPVLEERGYRLTSPAAVVLRLKFGVNKEGTISVKSNVETIVPDHPVDEPVPAVTTMYDRKPVYEKFISLTAVQAGKEDRQFWKARVSKTDFSPDFRTARDKLLYLLSHFIEKDSVRRVSAPLSEAELPAVCAEILAGGIIGLFCRKAGDRSSVLAAFAKQNRRERGRFSSMRADARAKGRVHGVAVRHVASFRPAKRVRHSGRTRAAKNARVRCRTF